MEFELLGDVLPIEPLSVPPPPECLVGRPQGLDGKTLDSLIAFGLKTLEDAYAKRDVTCFFCGRGEDEASFEEGDSAQKTASGSEGDSADHSCACSSASLNVPSSSERRVYCWLLSFGNSGGRRWASMANSFLDKCSLCALRYTQMQSLLCRSFLFHKRNKEWVEVLQTSWLGFDLLRLADALYFSKTRAALLSPSETSRMKVSRRLRSVLCQVLASSAQLLDPLREIDADSLTRVLGRFTHISQFLRFLLTAEGSLRGPPWPLSGGDTARLRRLRKQLDCLRGFLQLKMQDSSPETPQRAPAVADETSRPSCAPFLLHRLILSPFILLLPLLPTPLTFIWTCLSFSLQTDPLVAELALPLLLSLQEHWIPSIAILCRAALHAALTSSPSALSLRISSGKKGNGSFLWSSSCGASSEEEEAEGESERQKKGEETSQPLVLRLLRIAEHWLKVLASLCDRLHFLLRNEAAATSCTRQQRELHEQNLASPKRPSGVALSPRLLSRLENQLRALGCLYIEVSPDIPAEVSSALAAAGLLGLDASAAVSEADEDDDESQALREAIPLGLGDSEGSSSATRKKETGFTWQSCVSVFAALKLDARQLASEGNSRHSAPREVSQSLVNQALELIDERHQDARVIPLLGSESARPIGAPLLLHTALIAGVSLFVLRRLASSPAPDCTQEEEVVSKKAGQGDASKGELTLAVREDNHRSGSESDKMNGKSSDSPCREPGAESALDRGENSTDDFFAWLAEETQKTAAQGRCPSDRAEGPKPQPEAAAGEGASFLQTRFLDSTAAALCRCASLALHLADKALAVPCKRGACRCRVKQPNPNLRGTLQASLASFCSHEPLLLGAASKDEKPQQAPSNVSLAETQGYPSACGVCVSRSLTSSWKLSLQRWTAVAQGFKKLAEAFPVCTLQTLPAEAEALEEMENPKEKKRASASPVPLLRVLHELADLAVKVGQRASSAIEEEEKAEQSRMTSLENGMLHSTEHSSSPQKSTVQSPENATLEDDTSDFIDADLLALLDSEDLFLEAEAESLTAGAVRVEENWVERQLKLQQLHEQERRRKVEEPEILTISSDSAHSSRRTSVCSATSPQPPREESREEGLPLLKMSLQPAVSSRSKGLDEYRKKAQSIFAQSLEALAGGGLESLSAHALFKSGEASRANKEGLGVTRLVAPHRSDVASRSAEQSRASELARDGDGLAKASEKASSSSALEGRVSRSFPGEELSPSSRRKRLNLAIQALEQKPPEKRRAVRLDNNTRLVGPKVLKADSAALDRDSAIAIAAKQAQDIRRDEQMRQSRLRRFCEAREAARTTLRKFASEVLEIDIFGVVETSDSLQRDGRDRRQPRGPSHALSGGVLCRERNKLSMISDCLLRAQDQVRRMAPLPLSFQSEAQLRELLWRLLLLEALTALKSTLLQQRLSVRHCRLTSTSPQSEGWVRATFSPTSTSNVGMDATRTSDVGTNGALACLGDLVLLVRESKETCDLQSKTLAEWRGPPASGYTLGIVEREASGGLDKAKTQGVCVSVALGASVASCNQSNRINSQLHSNTRWLLFSLTNLTPVFREVEALIYLSLSPHLALPILNPRASVAAQEGSPRSSGRTEAPPTWVVDAVYSAKMAYSLNASQVSIVSKEIRQRVQERALRGVLSNEFDVSLIQGPPGTGKTQTILALIAALYSRLKDSTVRKAVGFPSKILVCAPSNAAVDEIAERILKNGLLVGGGRDGTPPTVVRPSCLRIGRPEKIRESVLSISFDRSHREAQGRYQSLFTASQESLLSPLRRELDQLERRIAETEKALASQKEQSEKLHQQRLMTDLAERIAGARREGGDGGGISSSSLASSSDSSRISKVAPPPRLELDLQSLRRQRERVKQRLSQERQATQVQMGCLDYASKQKLLYEADIIFATLSGCGSEVLEPPEQETFSQQERLLSARNSATACMRSVSAETVQAASEVDKLFTLAAVRRELRFAFAIVDEAGQATEGATLVPLKLNCRRLVLVGDPQQLPPLVMNGLATRRGLSRSTMARLVQVLKETTDESAKSSSEMTPLRDDGQRCDDSVARGRVSLFFLDTQYRMHPEIAEFSSKQFYGGRLLSAESTQYAQLPCFAARCFGPIRLFDVKGVCSKGGDFSRKAGPNSRCNFSEAAIVVKILLLIHNCWGVNTQGGCSQEEAIRLSDVGVLSPYKAQVSLIHSLLLKVPEFHGLELPEVNTVDGFQGREKKIMIISFVRTFVSSEGGADDSFLSGPLYPEGSALNGETDEETEGLTARSRYESSARQSLMPHSGSGCFVADAQRLNVSLTRASQALWLVGDSQFFDQHDLLARLKAFVQDKSGVVKVESRVASKSDYRRLRPVEIEEWYEDLLRYCRKKRALQQAASKRGRLEGDKEQARKLVPNESRLLAPVEHPELSRNTAASSVHLLSNVERMKMMESATSRDRPRSPFDRDSAVCADTGRPHSEVRLQERKGPSPSVQPRLTESQNKEKSTQPPRCPPPQRRSPPPFIRSARKMQK